MNPLFKKFLIFCVVAGLIVAGAMQGRRACKRARAKRCVALAAQWLGAKDFPEAARDLQSALKAEPSSVEATRLMAELLETTGSPAAIGWRIRATQLEPANMTHRLDWGLTAVKLHDLKSAQDALSGVDEKSKSTARYHKVAGVLAWGLGKTEEAQTHYQEARRLEPGNPSNIFNLGSIGLISTNREVAEAARCSLKQIATNGPLALNALRHLALDAVKREALDEAINYTRQVVTNKEATFGDKLDYLNLLCRADNPDAGSWLAVVKQQATNSPADAFAFGRWLARNEGPTNALQWLCGLPAGLQTKQPVPLVITECQIAVKDWAALASTVADEDWGGAEALRLAMQSLAERSLGREEDAKSLWAVARRESARRLDMLYTLTQLTSAWGWSAERQGLLTEIVSEFPREKWAGEMLLAQLHDAGETQELQKLLSRGTANKR